MKKTLTLLIGIVFSLTILNAQDAPPQAFSFKAMIKDRTGSPVINRTITLRISILQGAANGTVVYSERFRPTTNLYAQIDVEIGRGTVISGIFSAIDWAAGAYFLKVEVDPKGGINYYVMSVSQLLSVPYALYSGAAANSFSGYYSDLIGAPVLSLVATSGSYFDLLDKPVLFSGDYNALFNKPNLFSGYYDDLLNKPSLFDGTWISLSGKPVFSPLALSGRWEDLDNTPVTLSGYGITDAMSISHPANVIAVSDISNWNNAFSWSNHAGLYKPVAYVPDWSEITSKPAFAAVATSGSYNDLADKPTIDGSETIVLAGNNVTVTGEGTEGDPYVINSVASSSTISGNNPGDMMYWNGSAWVIVPVGSPGQVLTLIGNIPTWTGSSSAAPVAAFTATPTNGVAPFVVNFTDQSTGSPTSWYWDFGDGTDGSIERNPTHTFTSVGNYTVSLTVTNSYGSDSETKVNYITIGLIPEVNIAATPDEGTAPLTVAFTSLSSSSPTSWLWDFGDGIQSTLQNPSHTYIYAGTFQVTHTTGNIFGWSVPKTLYIIVKPSIAPIAAFTATPSMGTTPLTVNFSDQSTNSPTSWYWDFGDGVTSTEQNPSHTYLYAGGFDVSLTAINTYGANTHTKTNYIIVYDTGYTPLTDFTGAPTSGTAPLTVSFTDQSTNTPTSWYWDFGDGVTSTEQNPSHTYLSAGIFNVNLTATNNIGAMTYTKTNYIIVNPPPSVSIAAFTATPTSGLGPLTVNFSDQSTNSPTSWYWDFGDGGTSTNSNPEYTYSSIGNFTVSLTATNSYGSDTETKPNYITVVDNNNVIIFNPNLTYGSVADINGTTYKTIQIGSQTWMAENLRTNKYNDGTSIPHVTDDSSWGAYSTPAYCWYNNDQTTYSNAYGALYNWYAIATTTNGNKNVCPTGWHIPSYGDWTTLVTYLGGNEVASDKIKETGIIHWHIPNSGATNESGFTALPSGYRYYYNSNFVGIGSYGRWWSFSEYSPYSALHLSLEYENSFAEIGSENKLNGFSVRCVKE